jgi:hypothetical protein
MENGGFPPIKFQIENKQDKEDKKKERGIKINNKDVNLMDIFKKKKEIFINMGQNDDDDDDEIDSL